jgi:hypothetical protein
MLPVIFWVVFRRVVFNSRRFGTLWLFHFHRRVDTKMEQTVLRNVDYYTPHAGEQPKRLHATFRIRRLLEIKNGLYTPTAQKTLLKNVIFCLVLSHL